MRWKPFLGHQAWSWTTLRRGNVFYYVYERFFLFLSRFYVFNVFLNFYLNVFYIYDAFIWLARQCRDLIDCSAATAMVALSQFSNINSKFPNRLFILESRTGVTELDFNSVQVLSTNPLYSTATSRPSLRGVRCVTVNLSRCLTILPQASCKYRNISEIIPHYTERQATAFTALCITHASQSREKLDTTHFTEDCNA